MRNIFLPLACFWAIAATAAMADAPSPAQPKQAIVPANTAPAGAVWSGAYVGGQLGYGFGEFSLDVDGFETDDIIGGIHAGYLWDLGTLVIGPELQYDLADLAIDSAGGSGTFDEIARLKLKAGYNTGRGLIYGSAGLAYTNFDGLGGVTDIDFDDPGYVVGLGYDRLVTDNWAVGAEYQHHFFEDFGSDTNDVEFGTVHLRATYKF